MHFTARFYTFFFVTFTYDVLYMNLASFLPVYIIENYDKLNSAHIGLIMAGYGILKIIFALGFG